MIIDHGVFRARKRAVLHKTMPTGRKTTPKTDDSSGDMSSHRFLSFGPYIRLLPSCVRRVNPDQAA